MSVRSTSFGGCLLLLLIVAGDFQLGSKPSSQSIDCDHQVKNVRADDQGKAEPKFNHWQIRCFEQRSGSLS